MTHATRAGIGARIKRLRKRRGWTQRELARLVGRSLSQVKKYEAGVHIPMAEKIIRLSEIFDVEVEELLTGRRFKKSGGDRRRDGHATGIPGSARHAAGRSPEMAVLASLAEILEDLKSSPS